MGNKMGIVNFFDVFGQFEVVFFFEILNQYCDVLEVGKFFVMMVVVDECFEGIGLWIQMLNLFEEKFVQMQKVLCVYVCDSGFLKVVVLYFNVKGDGFVFFIVIKDLGCCEIEVELFGCY